MLGACKDALNPAPHTCLRMYTPFHQSSKKGQKRERGSRSYFALIFQ